MTPPSSNLPDRRPNKHRRRTEPCLPKESRARWYVVPRTLQSGAVARREAIDPEQQHGADDGEHDAPEGEAVQAGAGDGVADESADERANDPDDHGDDD